MSDYNPFLGKQPSSYDDINDNLNDREYVTGSYNISDVDKVPQVGYNARLEQLAKQYRDAKLRVTEAENQLKDAKAAIFKLTRETIPDVMAEVGMSEATLATGTHIKIDQRYDARYTKKGNTQDVDEDKKRQFHQWMSEHGFGGMIRAYFNVYVEPEIADTFRKICDTLELTYEYKESTIHYKTLESWVKEQHEAGNNLPDGLINLWIGREASVK